MAQCTGCSCKCGRKQSPRKSLDSSKRPCAWPGSTSALNPFILPGPWTGLSAVQCFRWVWCPPSWTQEIPCQVVPVRLGRCNGRLFCALARWGYIFLRSFRVGFLFHRLLCRSQQPSEAAALCRVAGKFPRCLREFVATDIGTCTQSLQNQPALSGQNLKQQPPEFSGLGQFASRDVMGYF